VSCVDLPSRAQAEIDDGLATTATASLVIFDRTNKQTPIMAGLWIELYSRHTTKRRWE